MPQTTSIPTNRIVGNKLIIEVELADPENPPVVELKFGNEDPTFRFHPIPEGKKRKIKIPLSVYFSEDIDPHWGKLSISEKVERICAFSHQRGTSMSLKTAEYAISVLDRGRPINHKGQTIGQEYKDKPEFCAKDIHPLWHSMSFKNKVAALYSFLATRYILMDLNQTKLIIDCLDTGLSLNTDGNPVPKKG